ncbi:BON domain-containing protein [Microvirga puerhi]|uniref:BON domain-containing protein n=1 Tax=Microvirga puerhi TaxID=2876078 RepID=A0ABS7VRK7_9HYPH|nr:BON domain-containing protein [Microvirga puerhi]MBZ6078170.1 BON domain-containing protein [Microvirga puerhi]
MANDRYRYDPDRYRDRSWGWRGRDEAYGTRRPDYGYGRDRDEDGYIARRGFGNRSSGYNRDYGDYRYESARERDLGDAAGYGSGGSDRDWRDVVGEDRERGFSAYGVDYGRDRDYYGYGSSFDEDRNRWGTGAFGRGSRDYGEDRSFLERAGDEIRSWFGDEDADRRREMDMRRAENRGRGPKGYQRSDERIREDVNDRLTDDSHVDASEIEVTVAGREVTLNGTVQSRFEKRHAEDIADSVSGVTHVQNNLRVQLGADAGMTGSTWTSPDTKNATSGLGQTPDRRRTTSSTGSGSM